MAQPPRKRNPGQGSRRRPKDMPRIITALDEETFDEVRARAVKSKTSFAEQVRQLVEWSLETAKEER